MSDINFDQWVNDLAKRTGASVEKSDIETLKGKNPEDVAAHQKALEEQYKKRAAPTSHRSADSQSGRYNNVGSDPRTEPGFKPASTPSTPSTPAPKPETFTALTQASAPADYVKQLYEWFLGRTPTDAELQSHLGMRELNGGQWGQTVLNTFQNAQEYRQRAPGEISRLYQSLLGRAATEADIAAHIGNPQGIAGIRYAIGSSPEYKARVAAQGSTPTPGTGGSGSGGSGSGGSGTGGGNTTPQFDDSSQRLIEDYALDRFHQRQNPDPNSGTALFEQYARELIDTLKGPVYSPQEEAVLKGKAISAIEAERSATKQRWIEEMSRRNIAPSSGIALDGILKIDEHFNQARNTFETEFAADAISATRAQRLQVLDTYGQLADSEEGRLREAGTYAAIPYGLMNDAFQRNIQLQGLGGNPSNFINSLLGIQEAGQRADAYRSQNRAALTGGLLQYLGYLFG